MKREEVIAALGELAAEMLWYARGGFEDAVRHADPETFEDALEDTFLAGLCLAAINHINGVSPE